MDAFNRVKWSKHVQVSNAMNAIRLASLRTARRKADSSRELAIDMAKAIMSGDVDRAEHIAEGVLLCLTTK